MGTRFNPESVASLSNLSPQERGDPREADSGLEDLERRCSVPELDQKLDGLMARKAELPDDLACFLQQQKQRQARLETTMRSFPTSMDVEQERQELAMKRKRTAQEVREAKYITQ